MLVPLKAEFSANTISGQPIKYYQVPEASQEFLKQYFKKEIGEGSLRCLIAGQIYTMEHISNRFNVFVHPTPNPDEEGEWGRIGKTFHG